MLKQVGDVLLEELDHGLLLPPQQIQPSSGVACLLHQTTTNSEVGRIAQIKLIQAIENVGIWTDSTKAEHRTRFRAAKGRVRVFRVSNHIRLRPWLRRTRT